jgi:uncharacterized protein YeaO (DUF488 family)
MTAQPGGPIHGHAAVTRTASTERLTEAGPIASGMPDERVMEAEDLANALAGEPGGFARSSAASGLSYRGPEMDRHPGQASDDHGALPPGVQVTSIYTPPSAADGRRVLIDPAWPRGLAREAARVDDWITAIAPSAGLRHLLSQDRSRFGYFRRCYLAELREPPRARALTRLRLTAQRGPVSLLTAEPDTLRCAAAVVAERLGIQLRADDQPGRFSIPGSS